MSAAVEIISVDAPLADRALDQLADVLVDCVEGGASVSFMSPFSRECAPDDELCGTHHFRWR